MNRVACPSKFLNRTEDNGTVNRCSLNDMFFEALISAFSECPHF